MHRSTRILAVLVLGCALVACGGGGGGDGPSAPSAPGTLRALAVEGTAAPGTAGVFQDFPPYPLMSAADGGLCAFVAPTTDGTMPEVLYAARADSTAALLPVFALGDVALAPSDGAIATFEAVWITSDGWIVTVVGIVGDSASRTFGVYTARITAGGVSDRSVAIYEGDDLTGAGGVDALASLELTSACVATDGTLWFVGEDGPGGPIGLWSVEHDGGNLTARVQPGDAFQDTATVVGVDAFGIDAAGSVFVYVASASSGGRRMVVHTSVGGALNLEFLRTGDTMPSGIGAVANVHKGGPIVVFSTGQVVWVAQGNQGGIDDVLMVFTPLPAPVTYGELIRSGDTATSTGMGTHAAIDMLDVAKSCNSPAFLATVLGSTNGVTTGTFAVRDTAGTHVLDSSNLAISGGALVPASWVDLRSGDRGYAEAASDGSFLFAQAFAGTSALFWTVRGSGTFALAASGGPAPGGDVFGSFEATSAHTVGAGNALFRADLVTAGSGIFRQGP